MLSTSSMDSSTLATVFSSARPKLAIADLVDQIIREAADLRNHRERRASIRHPYPELIRVTPADRRGEVIGESLSVVGKHLSLEGLGFFHTSPLPFKYVLADFELGKQRFGLLLNLIWCRFLREGWYDSGGKFVGVVELPHADSAPD